jgi:hypothetical protein
MSRIRLQAKTDTAHLVVEREKITARRGEGYQPYLVAALHETIGKK